MLDALAAMAEGLSFADKCAALGVAPHDSGMCVETATGVGGAIIPTGRKIAPRRHTPAVPFRSPTYSADEMLPRRLQDEEDALAEAEEENIRKDAEIAAYLTDKSENSSNTDTQSPRQRTNKHTFRPSKGGNRFGALADAPSDDSSLSPPRTRDAPQVSSKVASTVKDAAY